jgi:hypothetical protein
MGLFYASTAAAHADRSESSVGPDAYPSCTRAEILAEWPIRLAARLVALWSVRRSNKAVTIRARTDIVT